MRLMRRPAPFDHAEWIFELKLDGFRALAYIEHLLDDSHTTSMVLNKSRWLHTVVSWS
jgi:hypothetical protein